MTVSNSSQLGGTPDTLTISANHSTPSCAVVAVAAKKNDWAVADLPTRLALLDELMTSVTREAEEWTRSSALLKGIPEPSPARAEEWLSGPYVVLRNLRLLAVSLRSLLQTGKIRLPGAARTLTNGQVVLPVFPTDKFDRILNSGFSAEVWLMPGVGIQDWEEKQAAAYRRPASGKVALVLGGGNLSSIGPMDVLYKLFVENQACVLKMNPVNQDVGPSIERAFAPLVRFGCLRVVYGGAQVGAELCRHPDVDEIHVTGSDRTHDLIVYGDGAEGENRKALRTPANSKRITSELGNVTPVIVVPGNWTQADIEFQAENVASMLTNNAGFNCNAARVIVTHAAWPQRSAFLSAIETVLSKVPLRTAYYPGAVERFESFCFAHPRPDYARPEANKLPWTLIRNVNASRLEDICFTTEAFCSVMAETAIVADSAADFLARAVTFCNEVLWGTLAASILVQPESAREAVVALALDKATENLRYGTVAINHWAGLGYGMVSTPWGAFPGHDDHDIQSGRGFVHNTYLLAGIQKTVIRGPFRVSPKPPWFVSNRKGQTVAERLVALESRPSFGKMVRTILGALGG